MASIDVRQYIFANSFFFAECVCNCSLLYNQRIFIEFFVQIIKIKSLECGKARKKIFRSK